MHLSHKITPVILVSLLWGTPLLIQVSLNLKPQQQQKVVLTGLGCLPRPQFILPLCHHTSDSCLVHALLSVLVHKFTSHLCFSHLKKLQGSFCHMLTFYLYPAITLWLCFRLYPIWLISVLQQCWYFAPFPVLLLTSPLHLTDPISLPLLAAPAVSLNFSFHSAKWFMLIWNSFPEWGHHLKRVSVISSKVILGIWSFTGTSISYFWS